MDRIAGGYYLRPKSLYKPIMKHAAPCAREIWDYLWNEANFIDSKFLKQGQLIRSYAGIQQELSWRLGNTFKQYSHNQVKGAISFLKKHGLIITERVSRGILITICNYNVIQDFKNYESSAEPLGTTNNKYIDIKHLEQISKIESPTESPETNSESPEICSTESLRESPEHNSKNSSKIRLLDRNGKSESPTESSAESPEKCSTIYNIHQYSKYIDSYTRTREGKICPPPQTDDCDFDRDRGIFFDALPGVKTIQTFDDNADRKSGALIKLVHVSGEVPYNYTSRLEELNDQGAGIYLAVNETNGQGRKAGDIVRVRAVFADLDGAPIDPVWDYAPSMVIESSPGKYHAYWLTIDDPVDGVPLDAFRLLQEAIAVKFGSDPKVKDLPRVMRIPGFNHRKGEPFLSRVIHHTGVRYTYADLVEMFPPAPREKWSAPKYQAKTTPNSDVEFRGAYGAAQGGRNNHIAARIGGMINRGLSWAEIESEAHKENAACSPPLPRREVEALLKSMQRYA